MKTIGNVIWFLFSGLWMALGYIVGGFVLCVTIIGIPFGLQAFKFARFVLWPFGSAIVERDSGALTAVVNVVWAVFVGIWLAIGHVLSGIVFCVTIIGIPFGLVSFRLAGLSLMPFGKSIVDADRAPEGVRAVAPAR